MIKYRIVSSIGNCSLSLYNTYKGFLNVVYVIFQFIHVIEIVAARSKYN